MNGGEWAQVYNLKRDAIAEAKRQNAAIAKAIGSASRPSILDQPEVGLINGGNAG